MANKNIWAIIVTYNSAQDIRQCIKSLVHHVMKVVIIDNHSTDDTVTVVERNFPEVIIIQNCKNLGFARGLNTGIKLALRHKAEYILIINPDAIVKDRAIEDLRDFLARDVNRGVAGPVVEYISKVNGGLQYDFGGKINLFIGRSTHIIRNNIGGLTPEKRDYVSGCCMLIKSRILKTTGLFDEQFFMYYEDDDFCLRASLAGFSVWNCPKARIFHKIGGSESWLSSSSTYNLTKSAILFGRKWLNPINQIFSLTWIVLQSVLFSKLRVEAGQGAYRAIRDTI